MISGMSGQDLQHLMTSHKQEKAEGETHSCLTELMFTQLSLLLIQ